MKGGCSQVGLIEETEDAAVVRFEVKDTSIGMTDELAGTPVSVL